MTKQLHQEERRQFERLLHQQRMDRVGDRMAVLETFLNSEEHLDADGWQILIKERGLDLEPEFVEQTLELLCHDGLAERRPFEGGPTRYEHRHLGEHHDHLICTRCGSITEFHNPELEALKHRASAEHGFHHLSHRLQIYGLCGKCRADREPSMPLAMAAPGEKVRVTELRGGGRHAAQLSDLGLNMGSELEVLTCNGGPMVVAAKGSRFALGRGMADKIMVSPCHTNEDIPKDTE